MSKKEFFLMRAEEMAQLYASDFNKKEAQFTGKNIIIKMLEDGKVDPDRYVANLVKLCEVLNTALLESKEHLSGEKRSVNGIEIMYVEGGYLLNYEEDPIYKTLKEDLKHREELLKLAQNQLVIDGYGNDVPKVGKTARKGSLQYRFK